MEQKYGYKLSRLAEDLNADIIFSSADFEEVLIYTGDINRPGLQLAGFFDYFEPKRIQIIGRVEAAFMDGLCKEDRKLRWEALMERKIPALIMCHSTKACPELISAARKYDVTVLSTPAHTTQVMSETIRIVKKEVAPRITRPGVLVEVYGLGLLLVGESGIGKSEAAIELLKRGHRLIADDAVEIKAIDVNVIQGAAPELIRHYVELRGIGVVDVRQIFGVGAVKEFQNINLVINIEQWSENTNYDRLGLNEETIDILGVEIPTLTIPVKPGRNLAVILEVAAMNQRQKHLGYNAAVEFSKQLDAHLEAKMDDYG